MPERRFRENKRHFLAIDRLEEILSSFRIDDEFLPYRESRKIAERSDWKVCLLVDNVGSVRLQAWEGEGYNNFCWQPHEEVDNRFSGRRKEEVWLIGVDGHSYVKLNVKENELTWSQDGINIEELVINTV